MQNATDPTTLIVIVNTREADMTIQALRALDVEMKSLPYLHVAVADNDSRDGSEEKIRAAMSDLGWGERGHVVQVGRNGGFAVGNNAGMRFGLGWPTPPEYFFLLNPDTLVKPGAMKAIIDFMQSNPHVGLAGSKMIYPDGTLQLSSFRFHSVLGELERGLRLGVVSKMLKNHSVVIDLPDKEVEVDWVGGAAFMIRRSVIEKIGLLDENFFVYYEETEYCLRARRAGFSSWYVPQSVIVHLEGQNTGMSDKKRAPKRRARYWFDSRRRYFLINHGFITALLADLTYAFALTIYRLREFVQRKPKQDPPHFLWDFIRYSFISPKRQSR
jgi:N-acetylglucosaminyl-diphospho-decaprenol L-rhamnosyltransferase